MGDDVIQEAEEYFAEKKIRSVLEIGWMPTDNSRTQKKYLNYPNLESLS